MAYKQNYISEFKNFEGQDVSIRIEDRLSGNANPYGLIFDIQDIGGGNILVRCFYNLPAGATDTKLGYSIDGGASWTDTSTGLTSPASITIPNTYAYIYRMIFVYTPPTPDEVFYMDALEGVTDELTPGGNPCRLIINNGSEDKMNVISGMQLVMEVNAQDNNLLNKLLLGTYSDRRYYVEADINGYPIFRGWLQLADTDEPFLPRPVIRLTANDGLGSLKNKKLKDFTDANPTGKQKLIKFISWCLRQTGVEVNFNAVFNIREEDDGTLAAEPDKHCFNTQYLDAKTFETEVGESDDCYEVLSRLLKYLGTLGQRHGEWWFKNFDEYDTQPDYICVFDSSGDYVEAPAGAYYNKEIGITNNMKWSGHSARVAFTSPAKMAKLVQRYENPKEVPCNIDYDRGDYIADIDPDTKKYEIECWTLYENRPPVLSTHSSAYIVRKFIDGYEKERYGVIEVATALLEQQLRSEEIQVNEKDKFDVAVQVRYNGQVETSPGSMRLPYMQVRLFANDGTYYTLEGGGGSSGAVPAWVACTSSFDTFQKYFYVDFDGADDDTEWRSCSFQNGDCPPVPKAGKIYIVICHTYKVDQFQLHYSDLSFEYYPFINGNNNKYTGQHHKVEVTTDNNESVDEDVYVDNLPAKLLKGSLHKYDGSNYVLSGRFWNAAVLSGGPPDPTYLHPFGYIRIFNVWNQVRLLTRTLRGSIQGIESSMVDGRGKSDLPSVFHSYYMRDTDVHTNDKKFMLLSYEMDLMRCEFSSSVFREVFNEAISKDYASPYEFKYITR